ncbi:MAG: DUF4446 family protein [Sporichthyaceae bacterium]|nr:DUF4446 family protein [Sporichthyaceae bacterium]
MELSPQIVSALAIGGLCAGLLGLLLGLGAHRRIDRLRQSFVLLQAGDTEESFLEIVERNVAELVGLRDDLEGVRGELAELRVDLAAAIRHVAVVRYDAFDDVGGRLSWSAAMLDDDGSGLVLSSITTRTETRTYAKGVRRGTSTVALSPEERQVLAAAIGAARRAARTA